MIGHLKSQNSNQSFKYRTSTSRYGWNFNLWPVPAIQCDLSAKIPTVLACTDRYQPVSRILAKYRDTDKISLCRVYCSVSGLSVRLSLCPSVSRLSVSLALSASHLPVSHHVSLYLGLSHARQPISSLSHFERPMSTLIYGFERYKY